MDIAAFRERTTATYHRRRDQAKDLVDRIPILGRLFNEIVRIEFIDRCMLIAAQGLLALIPMLVVLAAFLPNLTQDAIGSFTSAAGIGEAGEGQVQNQVDPEQVRAQTGLIGIAYVVGHMVGNLQLFQGPEKINAYAAMLQGPLKSAVWAARIVLLSDGKSVRGRDPLSAASEAEAERVPVYTVALGTESGTIETRSGTEPVPPDRETLELIAERSGGRAFAVEDAARLREVYQRLGEQVVTEQRKQEITGAFAGGALLLLLAGIAASLRWFGRVI